ncbi:MAG: hypothetical protein R3E08_03935 [Thiotrichaceae bacterium]
MTIPILIFVASVLIGLMGRNRKMGFWGYFFGSLLLTPVIGLLLVLASDAKPMTSHGITIDSKPSSPHSGNHPPT